MSSNTSAFALRLPPEVKDAARELSGTIFEEPSSKGERYINHAPSFGSVNIALNYLLIRGLHATYDRLLNYSSEVQKECDRVGAYMAFFMANPAARYVCPFNLPEGSEPRTWLEEVMEQDPKSWQEGADRPWAADEYANIQRKLEQLSRSIGAIQRALAAYPK